MLTVLNYFQQKNVLHPSVIFGAIWSFQLIGLLFFGDRFVEPSAQALLVVVLGVFAFTVGSFVAHARADLPTATDQRRLVRKSLGLYSACAVLVLVSLYGQYERFSDLGYNLDFATTLVYARTLMSVEEQDIYGFYKYGSPIALGGLVFLELLILNKQARFFHKFLFVFFLLASLLMGLLSTGRGPVIFVFLLMATTYLFKTGINWRIGGLLAGIVSAIFAVFWLMGSIMGKADDVASGAASGFGDYLFSSIPAFSVYLTQRPLTLFDGDYGSNTFRFFTAVLAALGLANRPPSLVQEFVGVPNLTNLYTVYLHYVKDFGLLGVLSIPALLGFLHARIFRWSTARGGSDFPIYLLSVSYLPLLQTVFQETHFTGLSSWLQFLLFGLLMTKKAEGFQVRT
jgi:oligosaccharide repeat unit polymerase